MDNINLKLALDKFADALVDLDKLIELDKSNPSYFMRRADVKLKMNDKAGACKDWHSAVKLSYPEAVQKVIDNCN